jgi:hypothetical protein
MMERKRDESPAERPFVRNQVACVALYFLSQAALYSIRGSSPRIELALGAARLPAVRW